MQQTRILKKYNNRRLYDTQKSKYVTLNMVRELIREGEWVKIIDANTQEDVTSFILTQIILEQAKSKNFLLPAPLLQLIIQYGDNVLSEFFEKYLQQVVQAYIDYRNSMDEQFRNWLTLGSEISRVTQENLRSFNVLNPFMEKSHSKSEGEDL